MKYPSIVLAAALPLPAINARMLGDKKGRSGSSSEKNGSEARMLPHLEGRFVGNFTNHQTFNATSNEIEDLGGRLVGRPIVVYRNQNFDSFVAYEYDESGVSNVGILDCQSSSTVCFAEIKADLPYSSLEKWIIKEDGRAIESQFLYQRAPGTPPEAWIGTFTKDESGLGAVIHVKNDEDGLF
ncbi:hypothetical protein ACHAWF_010596 [Thalassiosira exigua]